MKLELKIDEAMQGHPVDEVIPVLAAYLAGLAVWSDIPPEQFIGFIVGVVRDTYKLNIAPPMKDRN